jgi:hypothetical protein
MRFKAFVDICEQQFFSFPFPHQKTSHFNTLKILRFFPGVKITIELKCNRNIVHMSLSIIKNAEAFVAAWGKKLYACVFQWSPEINYEM